MPSSAVFAAIDRKFYVTVAASNGGSLPKDLLDPKTGKPRRLTRKPADAKYRALYRKLMKDAGLSPATVTSPVSQGKASSGISAGQIATPCPSGRTCEPPKDSAQTAASPTSSGALSTGGATPKKMSTRKCHHQGLVVKCQHKDTGDRKYELIIPTGNDPRFGISPYELQVVGGWDQGYDTIQARTKILAGPCPETHQNDVLDVVPEGDVEVKSDDQVKFKVRGDDTYPFSSLSSFLTYFWPAKATPQYYYITAITCEGDSVYARVSVFPAIKWVASFGIKISTATQYDSKQIPGSTLQFGNQIVEFVGELRYEGDAGERKVSITKKSLDQWKRLVDALKVLRTAGDAAEFLDKSFKEGAGVEVGFKFPSFTLEGSWGWEEEEDGPRCDYVFGVDVGFKPFFGAEISADITDFLLKKVPGGHVLAKFKENAEEGVKIGKVKANFTGKIVLKASATIDGVLNFKKGLFGPTSASGKVTGTVEFSAEGELSGKGEFAVLSATAGIKANLKASLAVDLTAAHDQETDKLYTQTTVKFGGLILRVLSFHSFDVEESSGKDVDQFGASGDPEKKYDKNTTSGAVDDTAWKWTIAEPRKWYDSDKVYLFE